MVIETAILVIIGIITVLGLAMFGYLIWRQSQGENTDPFNDRKCIVSTSSVPSISGLPCCYQGGEVTPFRYLEQSDLVVGPSPVFYLNACSGFCKGGSFDRDTEKCTSGSSVKFEECVSLTKPRNCDGSAMPIAALATQLFYAKSATSAECPCTGPCDGTGDCS